MKVACILFNKGEMSARGQLGFYFSWNEFGAILHSFGSTHFKLSRSTFFSFSDIFLPHAAEHRGNASLCSPTPELHSLLLGIILLSGEGERVPG